MLINVFYYFIFYYFISFSHITHITFPLNILVIPSIQHACTLTLDSVQQMTSQATIGPLQGIKNTLIRSMDAPILNGWQKALHSSFHTPLVPRHDTQWILSIIIYCVWYDPIPPFSS